MVDILMNKKTEDLKKIPFRVAARTAKLIGLENFSTEEGAVIELVKNTYDADAHDCILIFDIKIKEEYINEENKNVLIRKIDKKNSSIYIVDNGVGMSDLIIQNQWMTIGTPNKLYSHLTEGGRVKTGAKGIGRFALNRLGMLTNMTTLPKFIEMKEDYGEEKSVVANSDNLSFDWMVDWKDFDKENATVSDIEAILSSKSKQSIKSELLNRFSLYSKVKDFVENNKFDSGTIIEITELNDEWNFEKIKKLFNNLEMLLPPKEQSDFNINLFLLNDLDNFGVVSRAYYDDYDYKLKATYEKDDKQKMKIELIRNELDVTTLEKQYSDFFNNDETRKEPFRLEDFKKEKIEWELPIENLMSQEVDKELLNKIGNFNFTFYFLKNSISDDIEEGNRKKYPYKAINSAERRSWLKKFGGIKIFRDDFRIRPYGENGDDWLRLGERQAQSPGGAGQRLGGYRIRPNQIAGTINISRIDNENFQDKSGREGLIENEEFELFKNVIREIISIFEKDRNNVMYNLSEYYKKNNHEVETINKAKEDAEIIRKRKDQKDPLSGNGFEKESINESKINEKEYSKAEENMADAIFFLESKNEEKDRELRLLRSLASVGLIISSFAHELHNLRTRLIPRTKFLEQVLSKHLDKKTFESNKYEDPFFLLDLIKQEDIKLQHWLVYSLNTLKRDKRERKKIDLNKYFEDFKSLWQKTLIDRQITLDYSSDFKKSYVIKAFEADLDCIFNNLLSNSLNALKGVNKDDKRISIVCSVVDDRVEIFFSDNGKGLDIKYIDNPNQIFNIFESSKVDKHGNVIGTGLGLSIVKTIISEYNNSNIEVFEVSNGLGFKISFRGSK
jgi:signal transduction histidine kinase